MAERNNVEYLMKPQTPKLTPDEVRYVYIPRASYNTPGLASFGSMHFVVSPEGNVVLNPLFVKRIEDLENIFDLELSPYATKEYVKNFVSINVTQLGLMLQEVLV